MSENSGWQEEVLFFTGDEFFSDMLAHLARAKESIDLESYIFCDDETGREFEDALLLAHQRGVKVRLMVDGIGSFDWVSDRSQTVSSLGMDVRIYNPLYLPESMSDLSNTLNKRNHRKSCVVDGTVAWVGSMNITKVHSSKHSKDQCWRDTGIRVKGDLTPLTAGFDYIWKRSKDPQTVKIWKPKLPEKGIHSLLVRSNYTFHLRKQGFKELLERMDNAQKKIYLTTAYLAPSSKLIKALCRAARRGVDVQVLLPRESDVVFMPWIARSYYEELIAAGVKIHEYLPCVLHAKTMVIDDWGKVGSTNLNGRSLRQDYEVDIVIHHKEAVAELEKQFFMDLKKSEAVLTAEDDFKSLVGRMILKTFKDWI